MTIKVDKNGDFVALKGAWFLLCFFVFLQHGFVILSLGVNYQT